MTQLKVQRKIIDSRRWENQDKFNQRIDNILHTFAKDLGTLMDERANRQYKRRISEFFEKWKFRAKDKKNIKEDNK